MKHGPKEYINYLVDWIQQTVNAAGAKGVILGLSGGVDSAVVSRLAQLAFPRNHLNLFLDCESSNNAIVKAELMINKFKLNSKFIKLTKPYHELLACWDQTAKIGLHFREQFISNWELSRNNTKSRLRMMTLYYFAQRLQYLVLGTGNASEWYLGYFTKYGDGACDLNPVFWMRKKEIMQIAQTLEIPSEIIQAPPTADLWPGQTDEKELNLSYQTLDMFLSGQKIYPNEEATIKSHHQKTEHKRSLPLVPHLKPAF